jgi:tetratricopeptide (TPR) repeat protein
LIFRRREWSASALATILAFLFVAAAVLSFAGNADASPASGDISALLQSAQHQFNAGNYSNAISTLLSAVSQNPSSAEAYYWLGRSYYEVHDYDSAVTQGEKSVSLDPKNSLYHQWLGRIYGGKADRDRSFFTARKVKKEFQTAVSLDPSNLAARQDLEQFCLDAPGIVGGSKDEARQQMDAIATADPVAGYLARAAFDKNEKNTAAVEKDMQQVLAAKPNRIDPYLEVADYYASVDKAAELQSALQAATQVNSKDPRLTFYGGVQRVLAGSDYSTAEMNLKAYLAATPDRSDWPSHASAREWLGRLYEAEGKRADAAEQYRASLRLEPGNKDVQARLTKLEKQH